MIILLDFTQRKTSLWLKEADLSNIGFCHSARSLRNFMAHAGHMANCRRLLGTGCVAQISETTDEYVQILRPRISVKIICSVIGCHDGRWMELA